MKSVPLPVRSEAGRAESDFAKSDFAEADFAKADFALDDFVQGSCTLSDNAGMFNIYTKSQC